MGEVQWGDTGPQDRVPGESRLCSGLYATCGPAQASGQPSTQRHQSLPWAAPAENLAPGTSQRGANPSHPAVGTRSGLGGASNILHRPSIQPSPRPALARCTVHRRGTSSSCSHSAGHTEELGTGGLGVQGGMEEGGRCHVCHSAGDAARHGRQLGQGSLRRGLSGPEL